MLDVRPLSVSHTAHVQVMSKHTLLQAQTSMDNERKEVRIFYKAKSDGDTVDVAVSCDGTWQHQGFLSPLGPVFVITHETGEVLDFVVALRKGNTDSDAYKW